jgi:hypothetical protein
MPPTENEHLEALVGRWRSEGATIASGDDPSIPISGFDDYEWFPGRAFLVHRVDVRMGDDPMNVLELIGPFDAGTGTFPMRSFDREGRAGEMQASVDREGVWTFAGDRERATLTIDPGGRHMTARWEQQRDGRWVHWMDMRFTREAR